MFNLTFRGGIHVNKTLEKKMLSSNSYITEFNSADLIYLPMKQHMGDPSIPIVKINDKVKVGQLIAKKNNIFSSNIHSSVSGEILKIEKHPDPTGSIVETIIIKNNQKQEWISLKKINNFNTLSNKEILNIIDDSGIVGLGGATFPTYLKYNSNRKCNMIILNGIECEPYNTADYILMKRNPEKIILGLTLLMKSVNAKDGAICIEENRKDIYKLFINLTKKQKNINIFLLKEKYPQGAEKQLIYALTKKEVPYGKLPIEIGIIVNNVGTANAVAEAVIEGKPLTHHYVTITGDIIKKPRNYFIPIGTPLRDILNIDNKNITCSVLIAGGLMMGKTVYSIYTPITKGINAFILLKDLPKKQKEQQCVRCSNCVDKCPMFLEPTTLMSYVKNNQIDFLKKLGIEACIECGVCSYVCPSYIPILDYIKHGKLELKRKCDNNE